MSSTPPSPAGKIDTLVDLFQAAERDEREAHDCYGIDFDGHEPLTAAAGASGEAAEAWTVPVEWPRRLIRSR